MKILKKEVFAYSENFKERVILDIIENHMDCHAAVRKYWGVESKRDVDRYRTTVRRWVQCYSGKGDVAPMRKVKIKDIPDTDLSSKQPPQTIEELLKENYELRLENAYLKKLRALVQAEEAAERKRRKSSRN